jgi:ubiquinone/menaquinone biosynthesis C-methylase UbiE
MKRRPSQELLDRDAGTAMEVADSLRDLRWFNRWFGGVSTSRAIVYTVAKATGADTLKVLEVASGEGYIAAQLRSDLQRVGIHFEVVLLDRVASHLPRNGALPKVVADAFRLPFPDASFDVVMSSLFVHHLSLAEAVQFGREALRVSRIAVLVHDLIRHPVHLALAYAGTPLYHSRITRNDAPASVWHAYTVEEMEEVFRQAGAARVEVEKHFLFRMGVIAWKAANAAQAEANGRNLSGSRQ